MSFSIHSVVVKLFVVYLLAGIEAALARRLTTPAYPIYAIGGADEFPVAPSQNDLAVIAHNFQYIQGHYSPDQNHELRQLNPNLKTVLYINSHTADGYTLEHTTGGRLGVLCYRAGYLSKPVTRQDTAIQVMVNSKYSPLKASTSDDSYSNSTAYVTFIRIGSELMKITAVTFPAVPERQLPGSHFTLQTLTVTRGFDGSTPSEHEDKANVLAPSYNNWPGMSPEEALRNWERQLRADLFLEGKGAELEADKVHLTYEVDPVSTYASDMLSNSTIAAVNTGYSGSWYDCYTDSELRPVDVGGKPLVKFPFWNTKTDALYTREEFDTEQRARLTRTWKSIRSTFDYYPTILANNVATFYCQGGREWLVPNAQQGYRPLDGFCLEDFVGALQPAAGGFGCQAAEWKWTYNSMDWWTGHVQEVLNASQSNLAVLPMMANAGCKSVAMEKLGRQRTDFERFAYASFLMTVDRPNGTVMLGIPAYYQENGTRYAHIDDWFYLDIGLPLVTRPHIEQYRVPAHDSFMRRFENAVVVVNPNNVTDMGVPLGGTYFNPVTNQSATHVDAVAYQGYIFMQWQP